VSGISGLVLFMPAAGGVRPTGFLPACALHADRSTLRPTGSPARRKTRSQSRPGVMARSVAGGTSCSPLSEPVTHWEAPT